MAQTLRQHGRRSVTCRQHRGRRGTLSDRSSLRAVGIRQRVHTGALGIDGLWPTGDGARSRKESTLRGPDEPTQHMFRYPVAAATGAAR